MNVDRYKMVLRQIEERPETWNQRDAHRKKYILFGPVTAHSFAGWAQVFSGRSSHYPRIDAQTWLELNQVESSYLFDPDRTFQDFHDFLQDPSLAYWSCWGMSPEDYARLEAEVGGPLGEHTFSDVKLAMRRLNIRCRPWLGKSKIGERKPPLFV